jgi:hypothetical protein
MKIFRSSFVLALSVLSIGLAAHAQATRTWVSGVGDDANPCSRTAPCKTFAGAISKTATGGEIDALDPGGFGALTITKSITIDGGGGQVASALVSGTDGFVVNAPSGIVTIRNMRFQGIAASGLGGLNGINLLAAAALHIEKCAIYGFTQNGININIGSGVQVFVDDTTSQDNTGAGISIVGTIGGTAGEVHASISNSHFPNNGVGVSGGDSSVVSIQSSDANGNAGAGFKLTANSFTSTMSITDSVAANNLGPGVQTGGGTAAAKMRVSNVGIFSNSVGFQTGTNGTVQSFGNNHNTGTGTPTSTIAAQ